MLKIGHRGACGHAPENTLLSVRKALEFKVDAFEFDIQMSKDGEPMVIHDATLARTTSGSGKVSDYTVKELKELDAGKGEKIPTLREIMDLVDKRCSLLIEMKAEHCTQAVVDIVTDYVKRKGWSYKQLMPCGFDHFQVAHVRELNPAIQTCVIMAGIPMNLAEGGQAAGAMAFNPCIHHISKKLVDDAHWRGLKVFTWTVNTPSDIAKAYALGVDGIVSDYPDRL